MYPFCAAGLSMLEGMLEIIPNAAVAHLGMCRNEETHEPMEYYAKMPSFIAERQVIIIDPMLATGWVRLKPLLRIYANGG